MRAFFKQLYYFTEIWTSVNIIDSDQILHGATPGTDLHCLPYKFPDLVKNKENKNSWGQTNGLAGGRADGRTDGQTDRQYTDRLTDF